MYEVLLPFKNSQSYSLSLQSVTSNCPILTNTVTEFVTQYLQVSVITKKG